jgi:hypothetical protein
MILSKSAKQTLLEYYGYITFAIHVHALSCFIVAVLLYVQGA